MTPNAVLCVHVSQTHQLSTLTLHWQKPLVNCTYGDHINYTIFPSLGLCIKSGIYKPSYLDHETFLMLKTIFWERVSSQVPQAKLKLTIKLTVTLSLWNSCLHPQYLIAGMCSHSTACAQLGNQTWYFMYAREVLIPNPTDHLQSEQKRKMILKKMVSWWIW